MREYAVVLVVAAAITYLVTPLARRVALAVRAVTEPRDRDVHAIPTPRLGGVAMYAGITVAILVAERLPALRSAFVASDDVHAVLLAGGVMCALGVVDDIWGLDALTKLAGQVLAAGVMVLLGVQLLYVVTPDTLVVLQPDIGVPLSVLLAIATVNAINVIDGLDGLAAGVAGIAALALFAFSYNLSVLNGQYLASPATLLTAVLAGACLGFLPHNFNPAQIFMGDSGALLLGLVLAGATISGIGQVPLGSVGGLDAAPLLLPILLPVAVLAIPFFDLLLAVVRRTRAGRSPFAADKQHLHHRLLELGHSHTRAVLVMYFWSALLAFGGVTLSMTDGPTVVLAVLAALTLLAVLAVNIPRLRTVRR